jgi:cell wall-associated NlpC family hydrolase
MSIVGVEIISKAVTNEQAVTNSLEYKGELFLRRKIYLSVIIAFLLSLAFLVPDVYAEQVMLKEGMSGQAVLEMQTKLQSLGYIGPDKLDGVFGPATLAAVISFQCDYNIDADGIAGPATLTALDSNISKENDNEADGAQITALKQGMSGDNVLMLQTKLKSLGYYTASLDGNFGPGTLLALIDFQSTNRLTADGIAGSETLQALQYSPVAANRGASGSRKSQMIASYAEQFLGTPYVYGGSSPEGFDCSGFTSYIYSHFGVAIPRAADDQYYYGASVSQLMPGDLVFFTTYMEGPSHAGIYIGDNSFIHSSSAGGQVIITSLSENYYSERYLGARRVVN